MNILHNYVFIPEPTVDIIPASVYLGVFEKFNYPFRRLNPFVLYEGRPFNRDIFGLTTEVFFA